MKKLAILLFVSLNSAFVGAMDHGAGMDTHAAAYALSEKQESLDESPTSLHLAIEGRGTCGCGYVAHVSSSAASGAQDSEMQPPHRRRRRCEQKS